jgi:hypothetical protein
MYYWLFYWHPTLARWRKGMGYLDLREAWKGYHTLTLTAALVMTCREGCEECRHVLLTTASSEQAEALRQQIRHGDLVRVW